jgi:glucuronokinase
MAHATCTGTATARAGVAGNPSDALGGAALAVPVDSMRARVDLVGSDRVSVGRAGGPTTWASAAELSRHAAQLGHAGGDRLVTAATVTLHRHLCEQGRAPHDRPFAATWSTTIPRSVGLAGSSAVVIATLRALLEWWDETLEPAEMARLALVAERDELGIAAGWMDRAVQSFDAPTLVDATGVAPGALPDMRIVRPAAPVELLVAWDPDGASPSGRLHAGLRARAQDGDVLVRDTVAELVRVAHDAAAALSGADLVALAGTVDEACRLRAQLGALDESTAALVEAAVAAGGAATSAGSGGAVLVVPSAGPERVADGLAARGVPTAAITLSVAD